MIRTLTAPRPGGVFGIVFVVLLFVSAAMASLPTAADSQASINAFYRDHASIVVLQQVVGALALLPFAAFAISLGPNRWLGPALIVFVAAELLTNVVPLLILPSPADAGTLTTVEDFADSALFVAVALFVLVATQHEPSWLRVVGYVVAVACGLRAIVSPLGVAALDFVAPVAFVLIVLVLSIRLLIRSEPAPLRSQESPHP